MKKLIYYISFLLVALSCQKQEAPVDFEGAFSYENNCYKTLEDAVNALKADGAGESVITLLSNTSGEGVNLGDETSLDITIDFKSYSYHLVSGASIDAGISTLRIRGNGACIYASDPSPAIKSTGGNIYFLGGVSLKGESIINTSSTVYIEDGYSGIMEGSITLDDAMLHLSSSDCHLSIPVLTVNGKDAGFSAETDNAVSYSPIVVIGKVESNLSFPVSSDLNNIISCKNGVHIHDYDTESIPGSCISKSFEELVCKECGYAKINKSFKGEYETCDLSAFVHYEAVEADEFHFGNVEYWQCTACGRCYSDPEGKHDITGNIYVFPSGYGTMLNLRDLSQQNSAQINAAVSTVLLAIYTAATTLTSILKMTSYSEWEIINDQIDDILRQVNVISEELNNVMKAVNMIEERRRIVDRQDNLMELQSLAQLTFHNLQKAKVTCGKDVEALKKEMTSIVADWENFRVGFGEKGKQKPEDLTMSLINSYIDSEPGSLTPKTYPDFYADFINGLCVWEHEGTTVKRAELLRDAVIIGTSYILTNVYCNDLWNVDPALKKATIAHQDDLFKKYFKIANRADSLMVMRDSLTRTLFFKNQKITYDRNIHGQHDINNWVRNNHKNYYFPYDNENGNAVKSCDKMMQDTQIHFDKLMTRDVVDFLDQVYVTDVKGTPFIDILRNKLGFKGGGPSNNSFIIPKKTTNFSYYGGSNRCPMYKIFHWHTWRTKNNDDLGVFAVGSINYYLYLNNPEYYFKVLYKCNISRWGGEITKLGYSNNYQFYSVETATEIK